MNGNFDFFTTVNSMNGDDADLIPVWETVEVERQFDIVDWAYDRYFWAEDMLCNAPEWVAELHSSEWLAAMEEAKAILKNHGVKMPWWL